MTLMGVKLGVTGAGANLYVSQEPQISGGRLYTAALSDKNAWNLINKQASFRAKQVLKLSERLAKRPYLEQLTVDEKALIAKLEKTQKKIKARRVSRKEEISYNLWFKKWWDRGFLAVPACAAIAPFLFKSVSDVYAKVIDKAGALSVVGMFGAGTLYTWYANRFGADRDPSMTEGEYLDLHRGAQNKRLVLLEALERSDDKGGKAAISAMDKLLAVRA